MAADVAVVVRIAFSAAQGGEVEGAAVFAVAASVVTAVAADCALR